MLWHTLIWVSSPKPLKVPTLHFSVSLYRKPILMIGFPHLLCLAKVKVSNLDQALEVLRPMPSAL